MTQIKSILIPAWSFYPSQEGGPSNALYWLASGLAKAGYVVRVVATNRCIGSGVVKENSWTQLNGFEVIYATVDKQEEYLKHEVEACDVLIANGVCSLRNFRLNRQAVRQGKKVILSPRGELFDSAILHKGKFYGLLKKSMFRWMKAMYGDKVVYHATSHEEVESIHKYMGNNAKVQLIPNYMILPDKVGIGDKLNENYLLYVGRLNPIKNIDVIISGLAKSSEFINSDCKFKIAGETVGEHYHSLVAQANSLGLADKVDFLGLVTGEEKDRLYAGAKCVLLMSKSENFGNVIVEALSQGTPAIASTGTPWQKLDEKGAGWWIAAEPDKVAECVDKLLTMDDETYDDMRTNAYAYSHEFDIYSNISKWTETINKI